MIVLPLPLRTTLTGRPVFSPDGRAVAAGGDGGVVVFRDLARPDHVLVHRSERDPYPVGFTPDGAAAVLGGVAGLQLLDVATGRAKPAVRPSGPWHREATVSADGTRLAVTYPQSVTSYGPFQSVSGPYFVARYRWAGGAYRAEGVIGPVAVPVAGLTFSADGRWLAGSEFGGSGFRVWPVAGPAAPARAAFAGRTGAGYRTLALSGDGRLVAVVTAAPRAHATLAVWDVRTRAELFRRRHAAGAAHLAFHPRRPELTLVEYAKGAFSVAVRDGRTGKVLRRYDWGTGTGPLAYSPDGSVCAMLTATELVVWDAE